MSTTTDIRTKIKRNSHILDLLSTEDLIRTWEEKSGKQRAQAGGKILRQGADYATAVLDTKTILKMINDLGFNGTAITKVKDGKQYIIFKGYAGNRSIFTAPRYLSTNPTVVDMSIGKIGVNRAALSGARYTIFLIVPLNVLNCFLSDQKSMSLLIGKTATDLCKVGIVSAISALAATATAATTTLAAGPLVVAIAVGIATTLTLDALDRKFGVTDSLVRALDQIYDNTLGKISREMDQLERRLKWQILNGEPVGEGIFY